MKKRVLLPILAVVSVLMLTSCGNSGPEKTVNGFMKSVKDLNLEEAGKHMTTELTGDYKESVEQEGVLSKDFTTVEGYEAFKDSLKDLTKELKYKITDTKVDGDNAEIKVDLTYANANEPIMASAGEMFGQIMGLAFSEQDMSKDEAADMMTEMLLDAVARNLKDYEIVTEDASGVIKLAKENKEWIITEIDESALNALSFGVMEGLESFDPFREINQDGYDPSGVIEFESQSDMD